MMAAMIGSRKRAVAAGAGALVALGLFVGALVHFRGKPAAPVAKASAVSLEVSVVAPDGRPAAGASVSLAIGGTRRDARTDAAGRVSYRPLTKGAARLVVAWDGAARDDRELTLGTAANRLRVALAAAAQLAGVVVDETGAPIAAVALQAKPELPSTAPPFAVESDAQGRFKFEQLPAGSYSIEARADLHELAVLPNIAAPVSEPVRVVLQRTAALRGEVLDDHGRPAADASVTIAGSGVWPPKTLKTDAQGHFELTPVPGGVYELRATHATLTSPPQEGVIVQPAAAAFVRLTLAPGATLRARVFDAESGTALRGVAVSVGEDALSSVPSRATTAADGVFVIEGLRQLPHRLWMHAPGYVPITGQAVVPREAAYELPLRRAATLSGIVVDETGHPVAAAELEVTGTTDTGERVQVSPVVEPSAGAGPAPPVALVAPNADSLGVTVGVVPKIPVLALPGAGDAIGAATVDPGFHTDAGGKFTIEGVPPGRIQLVVRRPGFAIGRSDVREVHSGEQVGDLRVVLPIGGTLAGRIVDGRGLPVPGVRVQVEVAGEATPRVTLGGDDGRFEFSALRGTCTVTAFPLNGAAVRQEVTLASGERRELQIDLGAEARTLDGRVLDARGFPVANATVHVEAESARSPGVHDASSAADGTFHVTALPLPPYRVRVEHPDYAATQLRSVAIAARQELTLTLRPGARVTGIVIDQMSNDGIAGARVRLRAAGGRETLTGRSNAQGKFEFLNVTLGAYELIADEDQHVSARAKLAASDPGTREVDPIVLQPAGTVSGDVVDRLGAPVFNAEVAIGQPPAWDRALRTDHAGHFRIGGVIPGEQHVSARHPEAGATPQAVPVRIYPRQESPGVVLRLPGQP
jgi:protocatechuate 3,4-dioxygenase beta subunit